MNQKTIIQNLLTKDSEKPNSDDRAMGAQAMPPSYHSRQIQYELDSERDLSHFLRGQIHQRNHDLAREGDMRQRAEEVGKETHSEMLNYLRDLARLFGLRGIDLDARCGVTDADGIFRLVGQNIEALQRAMVAALPILLHIENPDNWSGSILLGPNGEDCHTWANKGLDVIRRLVPQLFPSEKPNHQTPNHEQ